MENIRTLAAEIKTKIKQMQGLNVPDKAHTLTTTVRPKSFEKKTRHATDALITTQVAINVDQLIHAEGMSDQNKLPHDEDSSYAEMINYLTWK